jgi:CBS domain-containing protein
MDREFIPVENGFEDARVGDLMTGSVATVTESDTVADAARKMQECDCGALPVVDEHFKPVGIITDRDIALRIAPRALNAKRVRVSECMTGGVIHCEVTDHVDRCLRLMAANQVRRIPVVNEEGTLAGILSQADLARHADAHAGRGERRSVASMLSAVSEPALTH